MGEVVLSNGGGTEAAGIIIKDTNISSSRNFEGGGGGGGGPATASPPSSVVRWERILPKMVMRVLLVEADDSTRQIISALLRKCSYRVAAVPDGLQAWELLKGRPHSIDLILTEVELPSISGFALLTLIMEHQTCKNIPVIMMSSLDSVSTVYKCMMRGAADFLVKPIRKNELRNLWQHVWRRQTSSSGLGPPDESFAQQKLEATAENNAISNLSSGYMACVQRNRECIEKGSDAQSSCMKPEVGTEGGDMECMEEQDVSQPKGNRSLSSDINMQEGQEENLKQNNELQMFDNDASGTPAAATEREEDMNVDDDWQQGKFTVQTLDSSHILANPSKEAIDLIGAFDNYLKCTYANSASNIGTNKIDSSPLLDLSLRRSHHPSGSVNQRVEESHGLNHSDASAFSRYVNKPLKPPPQPTSPSTCDQQRGYANNSSRQLSNHTLDYTSDAHAPSPSSHRHIPPPTTVHKRGLPAPIPVRGIRFENLTNVFAPAIPPAFSMQSGPSPSLQSPGSTCAQELSFQPRNSQQYNNLMDQMNNDTSVHGESKQDHRLEKSEERGHFSPTDQSGNSSFCNGSVSHLHSISYGSSDNMNTNTVIKANSECGKEEAFPNNDGTSYHRSLQREAALTKFRLKRKERCYEKKVRYESRKKLAEQRPRVKGQFVRQVPTEPPAGSSA